MKRKVADLNILLRFAFYESINPWIFLNAGLIGTTICVLTDHYTIVPYCVPLFVQIFTRTSVKFRQRHITALVELPAQTDDPVFIMDGHGEIILSTGKTKQFFEDHVINNIRHLIGDEGMERVLTLARHSIDDDQNLSEECYAEKIDKWYDIKAKPAIGEDSENFEKVLVWFQNISIRKEYDIRLQDLLKYSSSMISKLDQLVKTGSIYDHVAAFMLSDYEAIYITRTDAEENLIGHVFKRGIPFIDRSKTIIIHHDSNAPILMSRRTAKILSDDIADHDSKESFLKKNPFDPNVVSFIGNEVHNFITYNEADVSIIAFNFKKQITVHEKRFIEVLLNISRIMVMLADLIRSNDEQFFQKIIGLCAAAEYSDEFSSRHVLRVNILSKLVAEKLEMDHTFINTISQVAALHDLGKVAMPELIKMTGKYTQEQFKMMQMHTLYGAIIIDRMARYSSKPDPRLNMAKNIILHHHQTYNGKGYPAIKKNGTVVETLSTDYQKYIDHRPLMGDEIPIEALIVSLADRYDSIRTSSFHKPGVSHEEAVRIMNHDDNLNIKGYDWHGPELWRSFQSIQHEFDRIYEEMKD
ncbi:HD domain-containing protein [Desulfobacterales bacterium HSG17]|nr:HD domain-containing protein [Desulfobacterales bacterium HSG17]